MVKVLVVDDEKDVLELLVDDLEDSGYEVISAENGAAALGKSTGSVRRSSFLTS